jgi:NAD(P)-dependent dehydrogenase (short-subunit alcohol dehydrogenase family)
MGAAVARSVRELGAVDVVVLDLRAPEADGFTFHQTDLGDPVAIDDAVRAIGGHVDALFSCQGIAGSAPGTRIADVMRVNFLGVRHLTRAVLPLMAPGGAVASISSAGGLGWERKLDPIRELLAAETFADGLAWVEERGAEVIKRPFPNAYAFSKQALIVWTMQQAVSAIEHGVRVNCTSPGSTATVMAAEFPDEGVEYMSRPSGRSSTPDEQARPLAFLNSDAASYVNGVNVVVDGGNAAARTLGLL